MGFSCIGRKDGKAAFSCSFLFFKTGTIKGWKEKPSSVIVFAIWWDQCVTESSH